MMVLDASVMVAALTGTGSEGVWARALVGTAPLAAPPVTLYPYAPCAVRAWELRANVTTHDAWYVALAELLDAPLATLDRSLSRASGPRCTFVLPTTA